MDTYGDTFSVFDYVGLRHNILFHRAVVLRRRPGASPSSRECLEDCHGDGVNLAEWQRTLICDCGSFTCDVLARTLTQHGVTSGWCWASGGASRVLCIKVTSLEGGLVPTFSKA